MGVKAPGKQKITARLFLKRSSVETSFQSNGLSPPIFSSLTRALNVTAGMRSPSCYLREYIS